MNLAIALVCLVIALYVRFVPVTDDEPAVEEPGDDDGDLSAEDFGAEPLSAVAEPDVEPAIVEERAPAGAVLH